MDTTTQMGEGRDIGPKISGGPTDIIGWPILSMLLLETLLYWLNFKCRKPISSFHLEWPFNQNYDFYKNIPTLII